MLLHPGMGIALLERAPRWTADAPARLHRRLAQARFPAIFLASFRSRIASCTAPTSTGCRGCWRRASAFSRRCRCRAAPPGSARSTGR
ncbi:hypothetical protein ACFQU2_22125 [Siccirubricoccus deserti]